MNYYRISRFLERLSLPPKIKCEIRSYGENNNKEMAANFKLIKRRLDKNLKTNLDVLELYHTNKDVLITSSDIFKDGFVRKKGNRGEGVYLSNHSRHSLWYKQIIGCYVIADERKIKRYISEIKSPWIGASDFLVTDEEIVYPKYAIEFRIIDDGSIWCPEYTEFKDVNCPVVDCRRKQRCDCECIPTILPTDKDYTVLNDMTKFQ